MTAPSSRDFAFIVNEDAFPNPMLVEISRWTKTEKKNVDFYMPNVIYPPTNMKFILKSVLDHHELFQNHRQAIKEAMVEAITSKNEDALGSSSALQNLGVESIIKQEISKVLFTTHNDSTGLVFTRRKEHLFNEMLLGCRNLRRKRLRDEHYLRNTFLSDVQRSKSELKYVRKKLKI
jgi:hypothetical protein